MTGSPELLERLVQLRSRLFAGTMVITDSSTLSRN
jgi:hypothetical protein